MAASDVSMVLMKSCLAKSKVNSSTLFSRDRLACEALVSWFILMTDVEPEMGKGRICYLFVSHEGVKAIQI